MGWSEGFEQFVTVVEAGSVAGGARVLGVPRATLSRQLSRLEDSLGVRLAHRTARSFVLTPEGETLYVRARRVVDEATEAINAVARVDDVPRGRLRVSAPGPGTLFSEVVGAFVDRYPQVSVELEMTGRFVDLAEERFDVVVRASAAPSESLVGRRLMQSRLLGVASPSYIERHGAPDSLEALVQHECVLDLKEGPRSLWPTLDGGSVRVRGRMAVNEMTARLRRALRGGGIALVPEALARADLEAGRLVAILPKVLGAAGQVSILYLNREHVAPKVRAFVDHVVEWLEEHGPLRRRIEAAGEGEG